jgi:hypothetical protein
MKTRIIFSVLIVLSLQSLAQPRSVRKMPHPINQPGVNCFAPFISLDGSTLVYLNDYTDDGTLALQLSKRTGADWSDPVAQARALSNKLNFMKGFTLGADGQTLFITSQLTNGVGGYDIYTCQLKGNTFSAPVNMGLPINSKLHDASPTISADGQSLFFMRCEAMNSQVAEKCKILLSKRMNGGRWGEPQELPAQINTGNSQSPRIMADGETLIFSSSVLGTSKGGMDLFVTRWNGTEWEKPSPLDFVNTSSDDQFVSVTSQGQYLLRDTQGDRKNELQEFLFPADLKPKAILRVDGKVESMSIPVYVSVNDLVNNRRIWNGRPTADGTFTTFLVEGNVYEVAIDPENANGTFSTRYFDLTKGLNRPFERYVTSIKQAEANDELLLEGINFLPFTSQLNSTSGGELRRLSRLLKSLPDFKAEIHVLLQGYMEDSVQHSQDLTELRIDSIEYYMDEIDSAGQLYQKDTLVAQQTFHNDRTQKQAEAILEQLKLLGCDMRALSITAEARPEAILDRRKLVVKAILRKR